MLNLEGFRIVTDVNLTKPGDPYEEKRGIRERLFSLPWKPMKKTKTIYPTIPSDEVIQFKGKLVMHPETAKRMKRNIEHFNKS